MSGHNEQVRLMAQKGYAFVEFASHEAAAKAIESMHDRKIKVIRLPTVHTMCVLCT